MVKKVVDKKNSVQTDDTIVEGTLSLKNDTVIEMPVVRPVLPPGGGGQKNRTEKELEEFYSSSDYVRLKDGSWERKRWLIPTQFEIRWKERHMGCNSNNCFLLALLCGGVGGAVSFGVQYFTGNFVFSMATNFLLYLLFCFNSLSLMEMWDPKALKNLKKFEVSKKIPKHLRETCMEGFFMYETFIVSVTSLALLLWIMSGSTATI